MTALTEEKLRTIMEDELGVDTDDIEADTLLFSTGIVDSFALVTLMMHVEKETGTRIDPGDVTLDNFDSMSRILAFASRAQA